MHLQVVPANKTDPSKPPFPLTVDREQVEARIERGSTVHLSTTRSPASEHHQDPVVDIQRSEFDIQYLVFDIQHFVSNIRQLIFQNISSSTGLEKTIERHINRRQEQLFRGQSN